MKQHFLVRMMVTGWALLLPGGWASAQTAAAVPDNGATLKQYCFTCHNDKLKTAGLSLESMDLAHVASRPDVWEKVIRKARVGMMPPQGLPQPDPAARKALVTWLETSLDRAAAEKPNPGRPLVHRLNRAEYANAIRDLLALNVDTTVLLPPDDSGYGFDNIADVLGVSPVLLEAYVSAAGKISALAVGDPNIGPTGQTFRVRQDASQDVHIEGLPLGTIGGLRIETTLPLDGEYLLQPKYFRTNLGVLRGLEYPNQCEITVDGERVHLASLGGDADFKASLANMTTAADAVDARCSVRVKLKAGPRVITSAFLRGSTVENTLRLQPFIRSSNDTLDPAGRPHLDSFTVTGPFNPTGPGDTPSRRQIFTCRPAAPAQEEPCARKILSTLMRRAYRGEGSDKDLQRLMTFYATGRTGGTFETGIEVALERMLASPKFVVPDRARSGRRRSRHGLPRQRPGAGVAAVVLPVEQHPRRRTAARGERRQASAPGGARAADAPHAGRSQVGRAGRQLCRPVAVSAQPADHDSQFARVPGFRRQSAAGVSSARPSCFSAASCMKTATCST